MNYRIQKVMFSSKRLDHSTPDDLFKQLDDEFHFVLDVCADENSAKCMYYPGNFGLTQDWIGPCWMNPPYGKEISKWLRKAVSQTSRGVITVALLPARTDTKWFWDYCIQNEIRLIKGRIKFKGQLHSAPFPSMIVVFR